MQVSTRIKPFLSEGKAVTPSNPEASPSGFCESCCVASGAFPWRLGAPFPWKGCLIYTNNKKVWSKSWTNPKEVGPPRKDSWPICSCRGQDLACSLAASCTRSLSPQCIVWSKPPTKGTSIFWAFFEMIYIFWTFLVVFQLHQLTADVFGNQSISACRLS